jgi:hypothetical protein
MALRERAETASSLIGSVASIGTRLRRQVEEVLMASAFAQAGEKETFMKGTRAR